MEWKPIETAPNDDRDILVGGYHPDWRQEISSRYDKPDRRGYRHRNGACYATHWAEIPEPPPPSGYDQYLYAALKCIPRSVPDEEFARMVEESLARYPDITAELRKDD